jgi:hypothetical protein
MKRVSKTLRHEFKYFITEEAYHTLRQRLKSVTIPDENARSEEGYLISTLYFDDYRHSALNEKIDGDRFRTKYRIRVYEHESDVIKLESKAKLDSWTAKSSTRLTLQEYRQILQEDYEFLIHKPDPLCQELYTKIRTKLIKPTVIVEYEREAYVVPEGNVRLTFDKGLRSSINGLDLFDPSVIYSVALPEGLLVFEVKYDDFIPKHIRSLINGIPMQRYAVSKYVICKKRRERVILHD